MENFRIVKPELDLSTPLRFWEVFEVDSFEFKSGLQCTLQVKDVYAMVDKFEFLETIPQVELISEITHYLANQFKVTDDMPAKDILSFAYLLYATPNLRMMDIFKSITHASHFNTTLRFLHENDREVPSQYLGSIMSMINDEAVYDMIISRYPIKLSIELNKEELQAWMDSTTGDISEYIKGVNATKDIQKLI